MHPYTDANYLVNKLPNHCYPVDKEVLGRKSVGVKDIKNGMFVIVLYDFATTGKKQNKKYLLALVLRCRQIVHGDLIWETSWTVFKAFYHGTKWQVLPYPILKRGVYEFTEDIHVDIVWFCNTVFMKCLCYSLILSSNFDFFTPL